MSRRTSLVVGCAALALLIVGGTSVRSGQQQSSKKPVPEPGETEVSAWLHDIFFRDVSAYDFYLDAEKQQKLVLQRKPAMRYPTAVDYWGELYVWTDRGRPMIVGAMWGGPDTKPHYRIFHEFHSLASQPLYCGEDGATKWQPEAAGIEFSPVPDALEPKKNPGQRLIQMREMASRFSANMIWRGGKEVDLKVITQPFYIYEIEDKDSPVVDGALFALSMDDPVDPEILLAIEAQRTDKGVVWQYAPIRYTNRETWVKYRDKEVWRTLADGIGVFDGVNTKPYFVQITKSFTYEGNRR